MSEESTIPKLPPELVEQLEVRIYPINDQDMTGAWAFGVFPRDGKWLYIEPGIFNSRILAAQSARVLCLASDLPLVECVTCQDVSYPYEAVLWRRVLIKGALIGSALFAAYAFLTWMFA